MDAKSISTAIGKANVRYNQAFFTLHQINVEICRVKQVQSFTRKILFFANCKPAMPGKNNHN